MSSYSALLSKDVTVFILAAGRGERMMPLTKTTPKPLLKIGEHALIEHHLIQLQKFGFINIIINVAYLSEQIQQTLGDGRRYGLNITFSDESDLGKLETAGGIHNALHLIQNEQFIVVNADVWTDFEFDSLLAPFLPESKSGRVVLIDNPEHHLTGDFTIKDDNSLSNLKPAKTDKTMTFSGIALYRKSFFSNLESGFQPLGALLRQAIENNRLEYQEFKGVWIDIGTPERLKATHTEYLKAL